MDIKVKVSEHRPTYNFFQLFLLKEKQEWSEYFKIVNVADVVVPR